MLLLYNDLFSEKLSFGECPPIQGKPLLADTHLFDKKLLFDECLPTQQKPLFGEYPLIWQKSYHLTNAYLFGKNPLSSRYLLIQ